MKYEQNSHKSWIASCPTDEDKRVKKKSKN